MPLEYWGKINIDRLKLGETKLSIAEKARILWLEDLKEQFPTQSPFDMEDFHWPRWPSTARQSDAAATGGTGVL